jgi:hypothetical protein
MEEKWLDPRRQPCRTLRDHGIPSVAWFEDAVAAHGAPTVVFDVYLLVPDLAQATAVLGQNGWPEIPQKQGKIGNVDLDLARFPQRRLRPEAPHSDGDDWTVVLLPSRDWCYDLTADHCCPSDDFIPPLPALVDALIESLLDCPSMSLRAWINLHLAYLYGNAIVLKNKAFAEQLRYEHRQYHLDICAGMFYGTHPFYVHQREVRQALREGRHDLANCSAPRSNEDLFNDAVQARLLARMPCPSAYDEVC